MTQIIPMVYIIIMLLFNPTQKNEIKILKKSNKINLIKLSSPPVQVYHAINKYAPLHDIPYKIAFGVALQETGYKGPLHIGYTYRQTSPAGAEGAMQFMPTTIRWFTGNDKLTRKQIRRNVEMNVKESMRYLRYIHDKYNNWKITLGYYNSGWPKINDYALAIVKI